MSKYFVINLEKVEKLQKDYFKNASEAMFSCYL